MPYKDPKKRRECALRSHRRYRQTEKGKTTEQVYRLRYYKSEKYRAKQERYSQSEKGKATQQRNNQSEKGQIKKAWYIEKKLHGDGKGY